MNESELTQLVARFELQNSLSETESSQLSESLAEREDLVAEILDRRSADGLLQLLGQTADQNEHFIARCLENLRAESTLQTNAVDEEAALVLVSQREYLSHSQRISGSKSRMRLMLLASAATVFLLIGAWGANIWINGEPNERGIATKLKAPDEPAVPTESKSGSKRSLQNDELLAERSDSNRDRKFTVQAVPSIDNGKLDPTPDPRLETDSNNSEWTEAEMDTIPERKSPATVAENKLPVSDSPKSSNLAIVETGKNGKWKNDFPNGTASEGVFNLTDGNASLKLNNGTMLHILAPAEFELNSENSIRLGTGNFVAEIPRSVNEFRFTTQFGDFVNPVNARLQVIVDPAQGVEAVVTRGKIDHAIGPSSSWRDRVELSRNGLFQSLTLPIPDLPPASPLSIARGKNSFQGQLGAGKNSVRINSPVVFANVLSRITEQPAVGGQRPISAEGWSLFAQEFQPLAHEFESGEFRDLLIRFLDAENFTDSQKNSSDDLGGGSTSFQGSLSINGVVREFNSKAEYDQARQQMLHELLPSNWTGQAGQSNTSSNANESIMVNGRPLRFSSPARLRALRKQMPR